MLRFRVADAGVEDRVTLYTGNDDNIIADLLTPYTTMCGGRSVTQRIVGGLLGHWAVWTQRAVELLREATTKFPDHLDIWCGLAFMYQESGDFENELATLKKMVAYAREHPTQLKWLKGEPLGEPADKFVPEKLHEYGGYYEKKENAEDDKRWFQIATLATDQYPNDPQGFKDAAGYWADIGEWQKARELYRWFTPLLHLDVNTKFVQYIKLAVQECGLGQEWVRAPRLPLVGEERKRVLQIIHQAKERAAGKKKP